MTSLKYLLDACLPIGVHEILSEEYVELTEILPHDAPDEQVLAEANKRGLLVITADKEFILRAIKQNQEIIYQNMTTRERYYLHGKLLESNCPQKSAGKRTKYLLRNDEIIIP